MPNYVRACAKLFALSLLILSFVLGNGQSAPAMKSYRVLRSISGTSGHEDNGRYIIDDPRSVFVAGKDAKVTIYFEWEGPTGPHHFEGLWKNPEGKIVLISDFSYEAKESQFSGYWSMLLSDAIPSGEWNLEARIDGEPAGTHSFVISGSPTATSASGPPLLSSADLYQKALDTTVVIEKLDADGTSVSRASGFWIGENRLLTAFSAIDGASMLRVLLRDGSQLTTDQVLAWNRWQDWALLKVEHSPKVWLKRSSAASVKVGDRCVLVDIVAAGAKLADGSITGKNTLPKTGERLLIASSVTPPSVGGPLLDEYGNYVGILGGSIFPGGDPIRSLSLLSETSASSRTVEWEETGMAVPETVFPDVPPTAAATSLTDLAAHGEMLTPVIKIKAVQSATLGVMGSGNSTSFMAYRRVFSRQDKKPVVQISWQGLQKEKFSCVYRLFNVDNKLVAESKPRDISLNSGKYMTTTWEIPVASIPAGIYRVDLVLSGRTAWREFLKVTD